MEIRLLNDLDNSVSTEGTSSSYGKGNGINAEASPPLDVESLVRKYWLLLLVLVVAGAAAGFASVVLSSPVYKASLILKIPNENEAFLKSFGGTSLEANEVNIQTQINILKGGTFLQRGADRLQADVVPLAPMGRDLFSRPEAHPTRHPGPHREQQARAACGHGDFRCPAHQQNHVDRIDLRVDEPRRGRAISQCNGCRIRRGQFTIAHAKFAENHRMAFGPD